MPGAIRNGLFMLLAWMAISVCANELVVRRWDVAAIVEQTVEGWISGGQSYVSEGRTQFDE
jgi:hypothetical protein